MKIEGYNSKQEAIRIEIEKDKIIKVEKITKPNTEQYILPGFIDVHTHGGYGNDFDDGEIESLKNYAKALPQEGTIAFLGTSATTPPNEYDKSFKAAGEYMTQQEDKTAIMLGIHSEGVYLDKSKNGAHNPKLFKKLTIKEVDHLIKMSKGYLKYITYAIENSDVKTTKYLLSKEIVPSVGHSSATNEQVIEHEKAGLKATTHTFNAMTGVDHRNPGIAVASMNSDNLYAEIIADGFHVHKDVIKMLYRAKGADHIIVITDSAPPKGMPDGEYMFVGYKVFKKGNTLINEMGSIAGSLSSMHGNFKNILEFTGCSLDEARRMTSTNAAKILNLDNKLGKIKVGYESNIILLDKKYNLLKTIIKGEIAYEN